MTREIKFRAWDIVTQEMKYSDDFLEPIMFHPKELVAFFEYVHKGYKAIQQFTGLLDKQGKEIYEGDIIKYWFPLSKPLTKTASVVWEEQEACWFMFDGNITHDQSRLANGVAGKSEVIGNIWQNPELLTGIKKEKI